MAELFGFNITRVKPQTDPKQQFSQPQAEDGTQVVAAGGFFGSYLDMEGTAKTEQDLIRRYREIALHPECDMAIEDIVNEAITSNENRQSVKVVTENLSQYSSKIRAKIESEFVFYMLGLLKIRSFVKLLLPALADRQIHSPSGETSRGSGWSLHLS